MAGGASSNSLPTEDGSFSNASDSRSPLKSNGRYFAHRKDTVGLGTIVALCDGAQETISSAPKIVDAPEKRRRNVVPERSDLTASIQKRLDESSTG